MSQGAFAKLLGVSVRVVQSWEQGDKKPYLLQRLLVKLKPVSRKAHFGSQKRRSETGNYIKYLPNQFQLRYDSVLPSEFVAEFERIFIRKKDRTLRRIHLCHAI